MSILTKNTIDFKPQFLTVDKGWISSKIKEGRAIEEKLNKAAAEVRKVFEKPLSDDELKTVVKGGVDGVVRLLKERAGFPGAETDAFFKLTGPKDLRAVTEAFNKLRGIYFRMDEFKMKNGRFILSKDAVDSYEKLGTLYTKCEKGNTAFKISQQLCEALNTALKNQLIFPLSKAEEGIGKFVQEKTISVKDSGTRHEKRVTEFVPNYKEISYIREKED